MNAVENLNEALESVGEYLKSLDLRRNRRMHWRRARGNRLLIEIKRSWHNSPHLAWVGLIVGVRSKRICAFIGEPDRIPSSANSGDWYVSLKHPVTNDTWWEVRPESSPANVQEELVAALRDVGLPRIESLSTDEALRDLWLKERPISVSERKRWRNLSILINEIGPRDMLPTVLQELERQMKTDSDVEWFNDHKSRLEARRAELP